MVRYFTLLASRNEAEAKQRMAVSVSDFVSEEQKTIIFVKLFARRQQLNGVEWNPMQLPFCRGTEY